MPKSVFTDAYAKFCATLVELRTSRGVTQSELAARLGKPQSFVAKVEQGARRLDLIEFCAICRALGVLPEEAFARVVRGLPPNLAI